jgi:hypothetical protein
MNPTDILLAAPFALLALAALPLPRWRRGLLSLLHRGGNLALPTGVAACGLFAFRPDLATDSLRDLLVFVAPDDYPGLAWLAKAALLLPLALPLLANLEHARDLSTLSAFLRDLRGARPSPATAGPPANPAADAALRPHAAEVAAAIEAM